MKWVSVKFNGIVVSTIVVSTIVVSTIVVSTTIFKYFSLLAIIAKTISLILVIATSFNQWAKIKVRPDFKCKIKDAEILQCFYTVPPNPPIIVDEGYYYDCEKGQGDKINIIEINKIEIPSQDYRMICVTGEEGQAIGCEGSFNFYDENAKIGHFYFDCPWGWYTNSISASITEKYKKQYKIETQPSKVPDWGPIGVVEVIIKKIY